MPTKKDVHPPAGGLRSWAARHVIAADGPRAGKSFRVSAPWEAILDAFDDSSLQQVTVRGSVQSGKTAALIVCGVVITPPQGKSVSAL